MALQKLRSFRTKSCANQLFYEQIQIFVCSSNGLVPLAIAWGDEGREIGLKALDVGSEDFTSVSTWFNESAEIDPLTNSEQPVDESPDQWFCSEPHDHKRFIDHLMFGDFAVDVLFESSLEHLGRISRSRVVSGSSSLPWQHYLNICSVVYGSRKSLILDEFFDQDLTFTFCQNGDATTPTGSNYVVLQAA